jgi:aspartyl-tRNA synthetase
LLNVPRIVIVNKLGLKDSDVAAWTWIVDFPMYEYSEIKEKRIDFGHNPFSMPQDGMNALKNKNPLCILAYQYLKIKKNYKSSLLEK